jgi:hypothetical protein
MSKCKEEHEAELSEVCTQRSHDKEEWDTWRKLSGLQEVPLQCIATCLTHEKAMERGRKHQPPKCEFALRQLCGRCEKENGRECMSKCKEEHEAELSEACFYKQEDNSRNLQGRSSPDCNVAVEQLCGHCTDRLDSEIEIGRRSFGCMKTCVEQHAQELDKACDSVGHQILNKEGHTVMTCAECTAAGRSWQVGQCNPTAECLIMDVSCSVSAGSCSDVDHPEEVLQPASAQRVLRASAFVASPHQEESSQPGHTAVSATGIIVGACLGCALLAAVVAVVLMRRRQQGSMNAQPRAVPAHAVTVVIDAPATKADVA